MNMTIDLTQIILAVLALIAALFTHRLKPWIKANTDEKQQRIIDTAIQIAVFAAEQIYGAGHGAEKMEYAQQYLFDHGYNVDVREIEAAVHNFFAHDGDKPEEPTEE